jgi:hypothetical protein
VLSPCAVEAIIAKLKWAESELKLVIVDDPETAADLQSVIKKIQEAITLIQRQR